jgi:LysM repeat protein
MKHLPYILLPFALLILLAACGPLGSDEPAVSSSTASPTSEPRATLPPMQIVTRTPVDPAQIPATPSGTPAEIEVPSTYVVQEGDSLYSIANRFQLDLAEIVALNGLSDPNDISVGQELMLPTPAEE